MLMSALLWAGGWSWQPPKAGLSEPKSSSDSTLYDSKQKIKTKKISSYIHYLPVTPTPRHMTLWLWISSYLNAAVHSSPNFTQSNPHKVQSAAFPSVSSDTLPHVAHKSDLPRNIYSLWLSQSQHLYRKILSSECKLFQFVVSDRRGKRSISQQPQLETRISLLNREIRSKASSSQSAMHHACFCCNHRYLIYKNVSNEFF